MAGFAVLYLVFTGQSASSGDAATPLRLDGPESFLHLVLGIHRVRVLGLRGHYRASGYPWRACRHPDVRPVRAVCFIPRGGNYAGLGA